MCICDVVPELPVELYTVFSAVMEKLFFCYISTLCVSVNVSRTCSCKHYKKNKTKIKHTYLYHSGILNYCAGIYIVIYDCLQFVLLL